MKTTNSTTAGAFSTAKELTQGLARYAKARWDAMAPAERAKVAASAFGPLGAMFGPRKSLASRVLGVGGVFGAGVLVGAATAAMLTPRRGDELRALLLERIRELTPQPATTSAERESKESAEREQAESDTVAPIAAARAKKSNGSSKSRAANA